MSPYLHQFTGTTSYEVVGKVVTPKDEGVNKLETAIWVSTVGLRACYAASGPMYVDSLVTFDGHCSAGPGPLEYRWTFGDGSAVVDWNADSVIVHHTYATAGQYSATLQVRVQGTSTTDDTTTIVTIVLPVTAVIRGPDYVSTSGTYYWSAWPSGGTAPYHYQWYYQRSGQSEDPVGSDSRSYSQWVTVEQNPYIFTLRVVVTDAAQRTGQATCHVQVGGDLRRPLIPPVCY